MGIRFAVEGTLLAGIALGAEFVPGPDAVQVSDRWIVPAEYTGERVEAEVTTCALSVERVALHVRYEGESSMERARSFLGRATAALESEGYQVSTTTGAPGPRTAFSVVMTGPSSRSVVGACGTDSCDVWVVGVSNTARLCIREAKQ